MEYVPADGCPGESPAGTATALHLRRDEKGTSAMASRGAAVDGLEDGLAGLVERPAAGDHRPPRPWRCAWSPSSGTICSSSSWLAVSVPVLSTQSVSTWLSDSTALACCTSAPKRDMRTAASA